MQTPRTAERAAAIGPVATRTRRWLIAGGLIGIVGGWWAFRPELLFIDARVHEAAPEAPRASTGVLLSGSFRGIAHESRGSATIYDTVDGQRVLRLTAFSTSNGPDVRVYLVALPDAPDSASVSAAEFVELGALKGNVGDQNYSVPPSADLARFRSVVIWCKRFGVNFGVAPLHPAG